MDRITNKPQPEKISVDGLIKILQSLKRGVTEIMTHPGYFTPHLTESYNYQREIELQTLTDRLIKQKIKELNIRLVSFNRFVSIV
jgi:predicted glycoside hydrolase/deacetylase ChbG (UPF0249 family)